jgi:hypothetical protein
MIAPATPPRVLAVHVHAALAVENVTSYNDYAWTDKEAVAAFSSRCVPASRCAAISAIRSPRASASVDMSDR